jgi:hypothetical protein
VRGRAKAWSDGNDSHKFVILKTKTLDEERGEKGLQIERGKSDRVRLGKGAGKSGCRRGRKQIRKDEVEKGRQGREGRNAVLPKLDVVVMLLLRGFDASRRGEESGG